MASSAKAAQSGKDEVKQFRDVDRMGGFAKG
jgi:hypothetical protein